MCPFDALSSALLAKLPVTTIRDAGFSGLPDQEIERLYHTERTKLVAFADGKSDVLPDQAWYHRLRREALRRRAARN